MTRLDGPTGPIVIFNRRTVMESDRSFASHLIQTPAFVMSFIAPGNCKLARIKVTASRTIVVDARAICKQRAVQIIHRGKFTKGQEVNNGGS